MLQKAEGQERMREKSKLKIFVDAVYMTFVYMLAGICINTVAAALSMEFYQEHRMLCMFFAAALTIPLCLLQMKRQGDLPENREGGRRPVMDWILLVILGISACIALNYWISMSGLMERFTGFDEVAESIYGGNFFEELLAVAVAAPVAEELLFRGIAYRGFRRLTGPALAMLLSALFFGIYHRNLVQGLYAFLLGLLMVWVCEAFGTIRVSIVFHIAANLVSVVMTECLDMSFLSESRAAMLAFTLFFTLTGVVSFLLLKKRKRMPELRKN